MDSLRISLIIIGVVILLVLYLWSRAGQKRSSNRPATREAPQFDVQQNTAQRDGVDDLPVESSDVLTASLESTPEIVDPGLQSTKGDAESPDKPSDIVAESTPQSGTKVSDKEAIPAVIALHIVAKDGEFHGSDLVKAANLAGMRYGEMGIFHFQGVTKGNVTFSMANMLEPGTFDMDNLDGFSSPGVLLFMESEFQKELEKSLGNMARVAERLCNVLDGQLCDEKRRPFEVAQLDAWKEHLLGTQPQL